jgi:hypothetical protein
MTKDDIIKLAQEAGLFTHKDVQPEILAFANLVAAAQKEADAKLCDGLDDDLVDGLAGWQYGEAIRARSQA